MSVNEKVLGENQGDSGGNSPDSTQGNLEAGKAPSPEWHQRVLSEKKREQEKRLQAEKERDELLSKLKQQEEAELKKKGEVEKLLKLREEELEKIRQQNLAYEHEKAVNIKLNAVIDALGTDIPTKAWKLIELDQVVIDPTTGDPDPASVKKVADSFRVEFPELLSRRATGVNLPNGAPKGSGKLTYDEWLKLPAKEMKKRLHEVI